MHEYVLGNHNSTSSLEALDMNSNSKLTPTLFNKYLSAKLRHTGDSDILKTYWHHTTKSWKWYTTHVSDITILLCSQWVMSAISAKISCIVILPLVLTIALYAELLQPMGNKNTAWTADFLLLLSAFLAG